MAGFWLAVVACSLVVIGGLLVVVGSDDPTLPADDPGASTSRVPTSTTAQRSTETVGAGEAMIGEPITFDDGGIARVNGVRRDSTIRNTRSGPLPEGATSTEIEVEHCIGGDDYEPNLRWQPPEHWFIAQWWTGILDDGTEIEARESYYMHLESKPGGCSRGYVTIPTPFGSNVVAVTLGLGAGVGDEPIGRWNLSQSRPIEAPLQPAAPPDAAELGEPVIPALLGSYNVTVLEVIDNATRKPSGEDILNRSKPQLPGRDAGERATEDPSDLGRRLVEVRIMICADPPAPTRIVGSPSEFMWLIETTDNYVGNPGGEMSNGWQLGEVAGVPAVANILVVDGRREHGPLTHGECVEGYVQIDLPEDAVPEYLIIANGDGHFREIGRVRLGT